MLRIERVNETDGRVMVVPLVGPESLRRPVALRWPDMPQVGSLVLVAAAHQARWLELGPLYRLDADRRLVAYGRQADGQVDHFDVCQPDRIDRQPTDRADWLHWRLTDQPPRRGVSALGDDGLRLAGLSATANFDSSGPWPAAGLSAPHPAVPAAASPGRAPSWRVGPIMLGATVGVMVVVHP